MIILPSDSSFQHVLRISGVLLYMLLWTCTCYYGHVHVIMDMYMLLWTCTCYYGHVHVIMDMYMSLWTCTCISKQSCISPVKFYILNKTFLLL